MHRQGVRGGPAWPGSAALLVLGALLAGCGAEGEVGVAQVRGPAVVAPVVLPPTVARPTLQLPAVAWPELASAPVLAAPLARPELVQPDLLDPYQVDSYHQQQLVVDVLWIVDNSGSMANERSLLASAFHRFIAELARRRIDYHLGVVSTQVDDGGRGGMLRRTATGVSVITPDSDDPVSSFGELVSFAPGDERLEQGLEAMRLALSEPLTSGANAGFLRERSGLAVIVVSDEDDGSFGQPAYFARMLRHARAPGDEQLASFSAVVGLPPAGCLPAGDERVFGAQVDPALRYLEVVQRTGGLQGSICDSDFEPLLEALGRRVGSLTRIFPLSAIPVEATLTVRVDGRVVPARDDDGTLAWSYSPALRAVVFEEEAVPGSGSEVRLAYVVDRGTAP